MTPIESINKVYLPNSEYIGKSNKDFIRIHFRNDFYQFQINKPVSSKIVQVVVKNFIAYVTHE